jgi:hypothetical protein
MIDRLGGPKPYKAGVVTLRAVDSKPRRGLAALKRTGSDTGKDSTATYEHGIGPTQLAISLLDAVAPFYAPLSETSRHGSLDFNWNPLHNNFTQYIEESKANSDVTKKTRKTHTQEELDSFSKPEMIVGTREEITNLLNDMGADSGLTMQLAPRSDMMWTLVPLVKPGVSLDPKAAAANVRNETAKKLRAKEKMEALRDKSSHGKQRKLPFFKHLVKPGAPAVIQPALGKGDKVVNQTKRGATAAERAAHVADLELHGEMEAARVALAQRGDIPSSLAGLILDGVAQFRLHPVEAFALVTRDMPNFDASLADFQNRIYSSIAMGGEQQLEMFPLNEKGKDGITEAEARKARAEEQKEAPSKKAKLQETLQERKARTGNDKQMQLPFNKEAAKPARKKITAADLKKKSEISDTTFDKKNTSVANEEAEAAVTRADNEILTPKVKAAVNQLLSTHELGKSVSLQDWLKVLVPAMETGTFYKIMGRMISKSAAGINVVIDTNPDTGKAGGYNRETNTIKLYSYTATKFNKRPDVMLIETLFHEATHAVTVDRLINNPKFRRDMQRLMNIVQRKRPDIVDRYGYVDVFEFVAEGFSNRAFQHELANTFITSDNNIITKITNALLTFIDNIAKGLGMTSISKQSALYALFDIGYEGIASPIPNRIPFYMSFPGVRPADPSGVASRAEMNEAAETERAALWREDEVGGQYVKKTWEFTGNEMEKAFDTVMGKLSGAQQDMVMGAVSAASSKINKYFYKTTDNLMFDARNLFRTEIVGEGKVDPIKAYSNVRDLTQTIAARTHRKVNNFDRRFRALDAKFQERLQKFMEWSSMHEMHIHKDFTDPANAHLEPEQQAKFEQVKSGFETLLSPDARHLYSDMVSFSKDTSVQLRKSLLVRASHAFDLQKMAKDNPALKPLLDKYLAADSNTDLTKVKDELIAAGVVEDEAEKMIKDTKKLINVSTIRGPYFPFRRYGDFVVYGERDEVVDFNSPEEAKAAADKFEDDATKNEVTVVGNSVHFKGTYFATETSKYAAQKHSDAVAKAGFEMSPVAMKLDFEGKIAGSVAKLAKRLGTDLYKTSNDPEEMKLIRGMRRHMESMILEMLAVNPASAARMRREGVAGVDTKTMFRGFAEYGWAAGYQIAEAETSHVTEQALRDMKRLSNGKTAAEIEVNRPSSELVTERGGVLKELMARAELDMDKKRSVTSQIAGRVGFAYFLTSLAYPIQNATQTWLLGLPFLGARHGYVNSADAISKAYADISGEWGKALKNVITEGVKGTEEDVYDAVMSHLKKKLPKEYAVIERLSDLNIIESTFIQELMDTVTGKRDSVLGAGLEKGFEMARLLPASVEILNRMVIGVAASRLSGEIGKVDADGNAVVDFAMRAIQQTQFDYREGNKPPLFRGDWGRLVFMFKMYPLGVYNLLGRSIAAALGKSDDLTRAEGIKQFMGIMATHSMVAGVAGGVLMEPIRMLVAAIMAPFTDDDDDEDIESKMRRVLMDDLGLSSKMASAVIYGPLTLVGANANSKLGLQNLLSGRVDFRDGTETEQVLAAALGPMVGMARNYVKAYQNVGEGNYLKAATQAMPLTFLRDFSKAALYGYEGIKTEAGNTRLRPDSITVADMGIAAAGFQPRRITDTYEAIGTAYAMEERWKARKEEVLNAYKSATDSAGYVRAAALLMQYQKEAPPTLRIKQGSIGSSLRQHAKRKVLTESGIYSDSVDVRDIGKYYDVD